MRKRYVGLGVVLLIVGGWMFYYGYMVLGDFQTLFGQLARALSPEAQRNYTVAVMWTLSGVVLMVAGLASVLYGAVAKGGGGFEQQIQPQPEVSRTTEGTWRSR